MRTGSSTDVLERTAMRGRRVLSREPSRLSVLGLMDALAFTEIRRDGRVGVSGKAMAVNCSQFMYVLVHGINFPSLTPHVRLHERIHQQQKQWPVADTHTSVQRTSTQSKAVPPCPALSITRDEDTSMEPKDLKSLG